MLSYWITLEETALLTGMSISTLRKWSAAGAIDAKCGRRFGYVWRFKRSFIESDGLLVDREKIRSFRKKYAP